MWCTAHISLTKALSNAKEGTQILSFYVLIRKSGIFVTSSHNQIFDSHFFLHFSLNRDNLEIPQIWWWHQRTGNSRGEWCHEAGPFALCPGFHLDGMQGDEPDSQGLPASRGEDRGCSPYSSLTQMKALAERTQSLKNSLENNRNCIPILILRNPAEKKN